MGVALRIHAIVSSLEVVFCSLSFSLFPPPPLSVLFCVPLVAGRHWQLIVFNQELNIGGSIVVAALTEACDTNKSKVHELYNSRGDLGTKRPFTYHFFDD